MWGFEKEASRGVLEEGGLGVVSRLAVKGLLLGATSLGGVGWLIWICPGIVGSLGWGRVDP